MLVSAPAGYEVAQGTATTPGTYAATQTVTQANATAGRTIYVRLAAATASGTYGTPGAPSLVTNASTGATTQNVAVDGTVTTPAPVLTANPTALTGFATTAGIASPSKNYTLTGANLTGAPDNITVTGSASYEVSADNATFGGTALVPYTSASLSATVYVRLKASLSAGSYNNETITNVGGGGSASVTVSGSVAPPATAPTGVSTTAATSITFNSATSGGNVTADGGSAITARGVVYGLSPNPQLGGSGVTQVTATGTTGSFTSSLTGLASNSTYYVAAYATNAVGTTYGADQSFTTPVAPLLYYGFPATASTAPVAAANVSGNNFARSSDLTGTSDTPDFRSTGFPSSTASPAANSSTGYYEFSLTVATGFAANLTSLVASDRSSSTGPTRWEVRTSLDNFTATVGTVQANPTTTFTPRTVSLTGTPALNIVSGTVIFRIYAYGASSGSGTFGIDDVNLYGTLTPDTAPRITASPTSLTFSAIVGQTAATNSYYLSGANLAANAPVAISSSDPSVLVSLTGAAPFAPTATATTSATGTLNQTVTVQFSAPVLVGTTTATITNTNGSTTATVSVTGTATPLPGPAITSLTPASGPVGTVVTLTGTGFTGTVSVAFNGTAATAVTVFSATSLQATVPAGATTGPISVSNANGTGTSTGNFTVTTTVASYATGVLLLEDDFNYPIGTRLTANGWVAHSAASIADDPVVTAGNITKVMYPTGPLTPGATNQAVSTGTGTDVNKGFTLPTGQNTVYYSAAITIPPTGTRTDYFLHLLERTNTSGSAAQNFRAKLSARPGNAANTFNLGVSVVSSISYTAAEYTEGQTYLVVVKYVYVPGGNDVASLFVFDNAAALPASEPATPDAGPVQEANNSSVLPNGFAIRQSTTSPYVNLDGIRVATGWGTVVGNTVYTEAASTINAGNYYNLTVTGPAAQLATAGAVNVENNLNLSNGLITTTAANSLTLYQSATTSGGSSTSFVSGPLARATATGASTVLFPIGRGGFYRPLTVNIANQTAVSTYTAEQIEGNPGQANLSTTSGNGLGTAPLLRVSAIRSFNLASSNTTSGNAAGTVTLSFGAGDGVNDPSDPGLVIAARNTSLLEWVNLSRSAFTGATTGVGGPAAVGTLTSAPINTLASAATFALGATNDISTVNSFNAVNPLPVELTHFAAQRQADNSVAVKWATASEKNSARFEVQRSLDGNEFATVATVAAQGTSSQPAAYAALDKTAPAATLYYRLRQVDRDGTVAYSPVVTVAGHGEVAKVQLYPNPARASVSFIANTATAYRVLNQLGQPLLSGTTEAGTATVAIEALPVGLYFLELQTAAGRVVQKFEKE